MVNAEFQAVILAAGSGSRMTELTVGRPKCLLPVGQMPILRHSLTVLEESGFQDVIVLVLESGQSEIEAFLENACLKIKYEIVVLPADQSEDWGTADSLRFLIKEDKIKTDVIILSSDLYTNSNISDVLNTFRIHSATVSSLFFTPYDESVISGTVPGPKTKHKPEKDIVGIEKETSRLVLLASASDFELTVPISKNILRRYQHIDLRTDLTDAHLYVISFRLIQYLKNNESFSSVKGELIPYIVRKQLARPQMHTDSNAKVNSTKEEPTDFIKITENDAKVGKLSSFNDHMRGVSDPYLCDAIRCYATIAPPDQFGIRVNSLQALCQANMLNLSSKNKQTSSILPAKHPSADILSNQIDEETCVGQFTCVKDKTSIKLSVLGENCVINSKTRLTKCILMKGVEVGESCILDNCVLCDGVKIGTGSELKDCVVGAYHNVPERTKAAAQILTKSDRLMEI